MQVTRHPSGVPLDEIVRNSPSVSLATFTAHCHLLVALLRDKSLEFIFQDTDSLFRKAQSLGKSHTLSRKI